MVWCKSSDRSDFHAQIGIKILKSLITFMYDKAMYFEVILALPPMVIKATTQRSDGPSQQTPNVRLTLGFGHTLVGHFDVGLTSNKHILTLG